MTACRGIHQVLQYILTIDILQDETIAQVDRSDDISQALLRQEIEPTKEVITSVAENYSVESDIAWRIAASYFLDEEEEYRLLEDALFETGDATEEMGIIEHPVFIVDPFGYTHLVPLSDCTYLVSL